LPDSWSPSGWSASEELSHFGWTVLLVSSNDVGFGKTFEAQFVDLDVGSEGDEANQAVLWQEIQDLLN
jgi:hypothetical protein